MTMTAPTVPAQAPAAPAAPPAPTAPVLSPLQSAVEEHRQQLAARTLEAPPAEEPPAPPAGQEPEPPAGDPPAPPAGDEPPPDPETPPAEEPPADEPIKVPLPPRRDGEAPLELEVADQETAEALQRLVRQARSGSQVEQERAILSRQQQAVENLVADADVDPVGFMLDRMEGDVAPRVALQLLADDRIWDAEVTLRGQRMTIREATRLMLDDEDRRGVIASHLEVERMKMRDELSVRRAERVAGQENARQVAAVVEATIPEDWPDERRESFLKGAFQSIGEHARRYGVQKMEPSAVLVLLAERLSLNGINPVEAATRVAQIGTQGQQRRGPASPPKSAPPAPVVPPQKPVLRLTGQQRVEAESRRAALATVPGAGEGTPRTELKAPPAGSLLKDASAWARKNLPSFRRG